MRTSPMTARWPFVAILLASQACSDPTAPVRAVATVIVSPSPVTLSEGESVQLNAALEDAAGLVLTERAVTWASSNPAAATVSASGLVTGLAAGKATIRAVSEGKGDSSAITVTGSVASVSVTPKEATTAVGGTVRFTASTKDSAGTAVTGGPITWTSSDTTIASVSANGLVQGRTPGGPVAITAMSNGKADAARLTVTSSPPVPEDSVSITLSPADTTLVAGSSMELVATLRDGSGHVMTGGTLVWSGSDDVIAIKPDATRGRIARVTALLAGETTVYANRDGIPPVATAHVRVIGTGNVASVTITPQSTIVFVGASAQLTAILRDGQDKVLDGLPVVWAAADPAAVSVSATGLVTGLRATGFTADTRITATSESVRGEANVPVVSAAGILSATPATATLPVGATVQLTAVVTDGNLTYSGIQFAWSSSDAAVATVDSAGLVTARGLGSAHVTAAIEGRTSSATVTVAAFTPLALRSVTVGYDHACGLTSGGAAYCWGANSSGQLGSDLGMALAEPVPLPVAGGLSFAQLTAGAGFSCGLTSTGATYCWGGNYTGQLGVADPGVHQTPIRVDAAPTFVALTAGGEHACGLTVAGEAYCWGDNEARELGVATTGSTCRQGEFLNGQCSFVPVPVSGGLTFSAITAGAHHTCGITTDDALHCWGVGGAIGVDSVTGSCLDGWLDPYPCSATPQQVGAGLRFASVSAGTLHTCALTAGGTAYCWGAATNDGSLGDSHFTGHQTPVAVSGGLRFAAISAGGLHTCATTSNDTAYCWGAGAMLGDGVGLDRAVPTAVAGSTKFGAIAAGQTTTCAVAAEAGIAYCWGLNAWGQLGDGTTTSRLLPVPVSRPMSEATR